MISQTLVYPCILSCNNAMTLSKTLYDTHCGLRTCQIVYHHGHLEFMPCQFS